MSAGFLDERELALLGLASCGSGVLIDSTVRLYGAERISIGSLSRIDAYAVISAGEGGVRIGSHVHVGAFTFLAGSAEIAIGDFAGLSARCSIYSSNDDYSGTRLTGPTVPTALRAVDSRPVRIGRHAIIGSGSVILPGVTVGDGAAVGALSLVKRDVAPQSVVVGTEGRVIGQRSKAVFELERRLEAGEVRQLR